MSSANGVVVSAAPPPLGVVPNFENPESIGYRLVIVSVVFPVPSLCFLIPRLYVAGVILRKWHTDDFLICVGFAFALANSIICIIQTTMGMGNHIWDIKQESFGALMKLGMIGGPMSYNLCTLFVKLSILSFYLRFSIDRAFRLAVYIVMFITIGYTVPNALLFLYICKPIASYWDWTIADSTYLNQQAVFDAANILNMLTDYMILLLPIWMLRPLRAPLLKKIGIALIVMTGGFVCGISTMRTITAMTGANNMDITWHYPVNLIWCLVEEYTGLILACLPNLKPFTKRFFPTLFLFHPSFEQRLSSGFPFSSLRSRGRRHPPDHNTNNTPAARGGRNDDNTGTGGSDAGRVQGGESDGDGDVGGRKAWWRLRTGVEGGQEEAGSVGKGSVEGEVEGAEAAVVGREM